MTEKAKTVKRQHAAHFMILETERLIIREIALQDQEDLFEMDSDPEVHRYIANNPVKNMEEITSVIEMFKKQYLENGIARWAVVDKSTSECLGWAGLKYHTDSLNHHRNIYELGYRFKKVHWGKGYATEASKTILAYGFKKFNIDSIFAITDPEHMNSQKVLRKLGFVLKETFDYEGDSTYWFELKRDIFDSLLFENLK